MKNRLECSAAAKLLVEGSRSGAQPDALLRVHLEQCERCRERRDAEQALSGALRALRTSTAGARSPVSTRATLLREFGDRGRKQPERRWIWGLAMAAVLLLGVVLVRDLTREPVALVATTAEETADPQQDGFIEIPYAPPLAQGELVRVVHTELQPAALASLGVNVDPAWTAELPADLLLGQDGFPRAVRVSSEVSTEGSFQEHL